MTALLIVFHVKVVSEDIGYVGDHMLYAMPHTNGFPDGFEPGDAI